MYVLLAIVGFIATASAKDVTVGNGGEFLSTQNFTASPAIWRQVNNVTINTTRPHEVIARVVIIDNREDKNGEANIVAGGVGHKNVTIELKSPAVFRGYDFEIEVYSKPDDQQAAQEPQTPIVNDQQNVQDQQIPQKNQHEGKGLPPSVPTISTVTQAPVGQQREQHPIVAGKDDNQQVRPHRDTQEPKENQNQAAQVPASTKDLDPKHFDKEWQKTIDDIFSKNQSGEKNSKAPLPDLPSEQGPVVDTKGDGLDIEKDDADIIKPKTILSDKEIQKKL